MGHSYLTKPKSHWPDQNNDCHKMQKSWWKFYWSVCQTCNLLYFSFFPLKKRMVWIICKVFMLKTKNKNTVYSIIFLINIDMLVCCSIELWPNVNWFCWHVSCYTLIDMWHSLCKTTSWNFLDLPRYFELQVTLNAITNAVPIMASTK